LGGGVPTVPQAAAPTPADAAPAPADAADADAALPNLPDGDAGGSDAGASRVYRLGNFECDGRYCGKWSVKNTDDWLDTAIPGGGCGAVVHPLPDSHSNGVWTIGQGKGFGDFDAPENPADPSATNDMHRFVLYYHAATTRCIGAAGWGNVVIMPACYHHEIRRRHPNEDGVPYREPIRLLVHPDFVPPAAATA